MTDRAGHNRRLSAYTPSEVKQPSPDNNNNANNSEFNKGIKLNDLVDVYNERAQRWCVAEIVQIDKSLFSTDKVHCRMMDADEVIVLPRNSLYIQPPVTRSAATTPAAFQRNAIPSTPPTLNKQQSRDGQGSTNTAQPNMLQSGRQSPVPYNKPPSNLNITPGTPSRSIVPTASAPQRTFPPGNMTPQRRPSLAAEPVNTRSPQPPAAVSNIGTWGRVLSYGLDRSQFDALDDLFKQCCIAQDAFQQQLTNNTLDGMEQLESRMHITELKLKQVQGNQSLSSPLLQQYIAQANSLVNSLVQSTSELKQHNTLQQIASAESQYIQSLLNEFYLVDIAGDGNCLFNAVGRGNILQTIRLPAVVLSRKGKPLSEQDYVDMLNTERVEVGNNKEVCNNISRSYRRGCIQQLQRNKQYHAAIHEEVSVAVTQHNQSKYQDFTSKAIYDLLLKAAHTMHLTEADIPSLASGEIGVEMYTDVMSRDGMYGTDLETQALSDMLQTSIHIYYRTNDNATGTMQRSAPSRVFGSEYTAQQPISLLFSMADKHYSLLIRKPSNSRSPSVVLPAPPPIPNTAKPSVEQRVDGDKAFSEEFKYSSSTPSNRRQYSSHSFDSGSEPSPQPAAQRRNSTSDLPYDIISNLDTPKLSIGVDQRSAQLVLNKPARESSLRDSL